MSAVFLKLLNMSITAGWLILAVFAARLLLKRAPRWISCLLWALVAVRLILPFSLRSVLSLIPSAETIPANIALSPHPAIRSGISALNGAVNPVMERVFAPESASSANPLQLWIPVASAVWLLGLAALLLYALLSYLRLRRTVAASLQIAERVYACDEVRTPFILGAFRPRIYVPSSLREETLSYVLRHEAAHLRRRDHWWKPLGFLLLSVYWFNPLCWLAYILLCRDIEAACDEKVIRDMDPDGMAAYSQALLDCSLPRKRVSACPLAFGETGVKQRVKGILDYKKPAFWILLLALLVCAVLAVCLMTDPRSDAQPAGSVVRWFDYRHEEVGWEVMERPKEISLEAYPGVVFQCDCAALTAVTAQGSEQLYTGMPIWSVYFLDLTGDRKPELCSTVSIGSGVIDDRIIVFDYEIGTLFELSDRMQFDYVLNLRDGKPVVEKRAYNSDRLLETGSLRIDGDGLCFLPESAEEAASTVSESEPVTEETAGVEDVILRVFGDWDEAAGTQAVNEYPLSDEQAEFVRSLFYRHERQTLSSPTDSIATLELRIGEDSLLTSVEGLSTLEGRIGGELVSLTLSGQEHERLYRIVARYAFIPQVVIPGDPAAGSIIVGTEFSASMAGGGSLQVSIDLAKRSLFAQGAPILSAEAAPSSLNASIQTGTAHSVFAHLTGIWSGSFQADTVADSVVVRAPSGSVDCSARDESGNSIGVTETKDGKDLVFSFT